MQILVSNAGITDDGLLMRMAEDSFTKVVDANLTAFDWGRRWAHDPSTVEAFFEAQGFALTRVDTQERAEALSFRGSPTVLIDGVDPWDDPNAPAGLSCRIYRTADGFAGTGILIGAQLCADFKAIQLLQPEQMRTAAGQLALVGQSLAYDAVERGSDLATLNLNFRLYDSLLLIGLLSTQHAEIGFPLLDLLVADIAFVRTERPGIRMGKERRRRQARFQHVESGANPAMAEVDAHSGPDHPPNEIAAGRRQSRIARLVASVGEDVGLVIGEDRALDASGEKGLDEFGAAGERCCRLEMEGCGEHLVRLRRQDRRPLMGDNDTRCRQFARQPAEIGQRVGFRVTPARQGEGGMRETGRAKAPDLRCKVCSRRQEPSRPGPKPVADRRTREPGKPLREWHWPSLAHRSHAFRTRSRRPRNRDTGSLA